MTSNSCCYSMIELTNTDKLCFFRGRYDYEEVESEGANKMVDRLRALVSTDRAQLIGKDLGNGFVVKDGDDFEYTDPIDGSVSKKQASGQILCFRWTFSGLFSSLFGAGCSFAQDHAYNHGHELTVNVYR